MCLNLVWSGECGQNGISYRREERLFLPDALLQSNPFLFHLIDNRESSRVLMSGDLLTLELLASDYELYHTMKEYFCCENMLKLPGISDFLLRITW